VRWPEIDRLLAGEQEMILYFFLHLKEFLWENAEYKKLFA
jgi:hypothetical protein